MCGPKVKDWGKNKVEKQIELGSNLTTLIFPHTGFTNGIMI